MSTPQTDSIIEGSVTTDLDKFGQSTARSPQDTKRAGAEDKANMQTTLTTKER